MFASCQALFFPFDKPVSARMRNDTTFLHTLQGTSTTASLAEPLAAHCTWRTGGPAAIWAMPHDAPTLALCLDYATAHHLPWHVVGLGSNVLFPDAGIDGVLMRLSGQWARWERQAKDRVFVGAGVVNAHLVRGLFDQGLVGAEFLMQIPGTFGGAVRMNAGTKDQELASILESVLLLVPGKGGLWHQEVRPADTLNLAYRLAKLPDQAIVLGGTIALKEGDVHQAKARAKADKARRNATQPYKLASVGSTFANPPGDWAGRLIEACGLKGHSLGGASISTMHANFLINTQGQATSDDFLRLMALIRHTVRRTFGLTLRPEVQFVGLDGLALMDAYEPHEEATA